MKADRDGAHLEELDLVIPNMDTDEMQLRAGEIVRGLPGVQAVQLVDGGALVSYRAGAVTKEEICGALRQSGFRAGVFQDSLTGETGTSSI